MKHIKTSLLKVKSHPSYYKWLHWIKLLSITGLAQVIVQATGMVTGILIVRLLPVEEYAYYTLANAMLGVMSVLSDGGISSGVMAQGGKVWQDKEKLGTVLITGVNLRGYFASICLILSLPILAYLLWQHGASSLFIILILASLIPTFYADLSNSLLQNISKLHQDITPLQKNQVIVSMGRLFFNGICLFIFPWTAVALISNGLPQIYGNIQLRKIVAKRISSNVSPDPKIRKAILKNVRKIMPGAIYYALSGQLSIWLISFLGSTNSIASIGALGRFSGLMSIVTMMISILIIPRFARMQNSRKNLLSFFLTVFCSIVFICLFIVSFCYFFSDQLLSLLGNKYKALNIELTLVISASCLSTLSGFVFGMGTSRGKPTNSVIIIILNLLVIVSGCIIFDLSTLRGVLWYNLYINSFPFLIHIANFYFNIYLKADD